MDRVIIDPMRVSAKPISIPVLIAGMLLFFRAAADELPLQLFREGRWADCQRECHRILLKDPDSAPLPVQLINIACSIQLKSKEPHQLLLELEPLATQTEDTETAAIASYESGRLLWSLGQDAEALDSFSASFQTTTNRALFLESACSAFLVMEENRSLRKENPDLARQINSTRDLWSGALFETCRREQKSGAASFSPSSAFIKFYRTQISPAIGQRCTLHPSCSEYFCQASHQHGPLCVPMIADRFVREPGLNNRKEHPVLIDGSVRYADPVHDHSFWMK